MTYAKERAVENGKPDQVAKNSISRKKAASSQSVPTTKAATNSSDWTDSDKIWEACSKAMDAAASLKAQTDARLQLAARHLGFAEIGDRRWVKQCRFCRRKVALLATTSGDVRVSGYESGLTCSAIPSIQKWLFDNGFQS
ncbi:hypothetical protein [Bradyrhizobium pachyrhizi]|uniref:hypothetical protein n=1 Tax=Bradyrhizobium pachyrhizi TaxID=280333 RepID=UPI00128F6511|nr:hypothetical protein [Bradyrhizobium pachyrhizi]